MLREGISGAGIQLNSWSLFGRNRMPLQALHLHWIESVAMGRLARRSLVVTHLLFLKLETEIRRIRMAGGRLVWTVHNAHPHERDATRRSRLINYWINRLTRQVDVAISLSHAALAPIADSYPALAAPVVVIPHQHYRDHYPAGNRHRGRARFRLPPKARVIGMIGLLRSYKNISNGIAQFAKISDQDCYLLIAGNCFDQALYSELRDICRKTPRVILHIGHLEDEDFADAHACVDMILSMQRDILNSGSVMAALSLGRPVLAHQVGALPELVEAVGDDWLTLRKEVSHLDILESLDRGIPPSQPDLTQFDVATIIARHIDVYTRNLHEFAR